MGNFKILSILSAGLGSSLIYSRAVPCSLGFPWCLLNLLSLQNLHQTRFLLHFGHQIKFWALFCEQKAPPDFSFALIPGQSVFFCIIVEMLSNNPIKPVLLMDINVIIKNLRCSSPLCESFLVFYMEFEAVPENWGGIFFFFLLRIHILKF